MVNRALTIARVAALAAAGCGKFQDPNIVLDLRVLAMTAQPPTQVVDVDLTKPIDPVAVAAELVPIQLCALVADPGLDRRLLWSMTMCPPTSDDRCADGDPQFVVGGGLLDDPDITVPEPQMCTAIPVDVNLLTVLANVLSGDVLHGLGGVNVSVQLRVGGENGNRALDQYAAKIFEVAPRIPATATANTNPRIDRIDTSIDDGPTTPLPLGRCVDNPMPLTIAASTTLRMTPVEPDGVREVYTVPTLDGKTQTFTESLTYQWVATNGGFSSGSTGGPRDLTGNPPPLFSDYRAPAASDLTGPTDVSIYLIQRDERFGAHWYEACVRVMP